MPHTRYFFLMIKSVLWFLTVVIVSARYSAESFPAINKTSGFAVPHSTQDDKHDKQNIPGSDEGPHEERETFAIDSFILSVKAADESLPRTKNAENMVDVPQIKEDNKALAIHEAKMMDVPQIKEHNIALATRMETLGIDIDGVVLVTKALKSAFKDFSLNNLEWMVLGKVYFERDRSSTGYKVLSSQQLFKELNMEIINYEEITKWTGMFKNLNVVARMVFGKMLWLVQNRNELNLHLADVAKMAFGSEYLNTRKLPSFETILRVVGEHNVDKDLLKSILRQDKDSRKRKAPTVLGPFEIESFTSLVKTADESLPRTKNAASMMDVSEIKERNQGLATQMEKLGIAIDGVVFVTEALKSKFESLFSRNNLGWMILGKVYFEKVERTSFGYRGLNSKELFKKLNMEIIDHEKIQKWTARFHNFRVAAEKVFGKMLWLLKDQKEFKLDVADAAKMAFGSELLKDRKLPFSDELLQAMTKHKPDKHGTESLIRQDKDSTMTDIAVDKLLETIRNYFDEEVHEPSKKKRKLA